MKVYDSARMQVRDQGATGVGHRLMRVGALLLVVPLLAVVGAGSPAQAADQVGVPAAEPGSTEAKLIVTKGGDRTATGVSPLAGATFQFFRAGSASALSGGTALLDANNVAVTCTTDVSGQCGVIVPLVGSSDNFFYAEEVATPSGWSEADVWGSATDYLRYNSGAVRSSNTNRVRNLPPTGRTWPDVRDNPTAPQKCGLDIRMIFDVSGSIDDSELATFKNAGKGVITALEGTPSRVSLSRFATQAAEVKPLTSVTSTSSADTVRAAIDGINRSGFGQYTNWDRALWGSATSGETYDVALIITDGDPTVYGDLTSGNTELRQVEEAIHSANALKAKGTQVISVGIDLTAAASIKRLNLISSPGSTYTTSWQQLGPDLKKIATGFCNKVVTLQKVVKDWQGNVLTNSTESNGWQFGGGIDSPATIGAFAPTAMVNGQNGFTSAPVAISAGQSPTVTITETPRAGWAYQGATCTVDGQDVAVTQTQTPGRFTFPGKANTAMTCVVTNQQAPPAPKLTLVKKVLNADGTQAPASAGEAWTLSATGDGGFSGAGNTAAVTAKDVKAGVQYALGESSRAGYTNGTTWSCLKDSGAGSITFTAPDKVTLAAGQAVTCTITNQVQLADLTVIKTALPKFDRDYDWTIVKSVTRGSRFEVPEGTSASVGYQVVVTPSSAKNTNFKVTGTITITNPNATAIAGVTITDSLPGATCALDSGAATRTIQPGTTGIPYTCTLSNGTPATKGTNTVNLAWNPAGYNGTTGAASATAGFDFADAAVTTTDGAAKVTDSMVDVDGTGPDGVVVNAGDGQQTFTYSRSIAGVPGKCTVYDNKATVKPSDSDGTSDTRSVTVCVGSDLDVDKVATLAYDRDYKWKVTKTGPGHLFVGANGATASYDVKLETDGYTDHDWKLGGTIWISNPNSWDVPVHIDDLTTLDNTTPTCAVTGGSDVVVPANANRKAYTYTCTDVKQGDYHGSNTATITWDKATYFTPRGSDDKTVPVDVSAVAAPAHASVTLSDVFDGGTATTVGDGPYSWTAVDGSPVTVTYTRPVTAKAGECRTYVNTVSVVGTSADSSATTEVCQPGIDKSVTAEFGRRQTWSLTKEVDKTSVELGPKGDARFTYTVTATPGAVVDEGMATWSGVITVTNPSDTETFEGTVTDTPAVSGWTCSIIGDGKVSLQPGKSANVSYTCSTEGTGHPDGTNTATVAWGDHSTATSAPVVFSPTGTIDGTTTITDDIPGDGLPAVQFPVDATKGANVFTYSRDLGSAAGACATYTNTAVLAVTGDDPTAKQDVKVCREKPLGVHVDAYGVFDRDYHWDIAKKVDRTVVEVDEETGSAAFTYTVTVDALDPTDSDYDLWGTATVTNPNSYADGAITLTGGSIATTMGGGADCTPTAPIAGRVIPAGASRDIDFTCDFDSTPSKSGTVTVAVRWDPAGEATSATATDDEGVTFGIDDKRDEYVDVIDDKTDPSDPKVLESGLKWQPDLHKTYTYELTHKGTAGTCVDYTNTAVVDLTPSRDELARAASDEGNPKATKTVTVCVERPLGVDVSASGDLERAYAWSVAKAADQTSRTVDANGNATFRYTVTVRAGEETSSGWRMTGTATITNPNEYADGDITADVTATTDLGGGSVCTVAGGDDVVIEDDSQVRLPVSCTFTSAPAGSGGLTVLATWDPAGAASADTSSATGGVEFTSRGDSDRTVAVVDDQTVPGQRVVLDPALTWTAGLVKTYTYDLTVRGGPAGACASYTNTAMVDVAGGVDPSASATVQACAPQVLPAQSFGKAVGKVRASCQGTVKAKLSNRSGETVTYTLRVGKKVHKIKVRSLAKKKFVTKGQARAKVTLKIGSTRLDKLRIPALCQAPEVLPDTGLRGTSS